MQGRLRLLCACSSPKDHLAPHGRLPYLLCPGHRPGWQHRSHPGHPHIHGPHRRGQRLGHDPGGHGGDRGQGQPTDHPSLCLDPAGDRPPQRRLHGLRRPRGRGLHPKRRLHRQLQRSRSPDPGHLRRSIDQVVNSTAVKSSLNGGAANDTLTGGSANGHPDRGTGRRRDEGDERKRSALRPRPDLRHDDQLRRRDRHPGSADKADLDPLPKDPSPVSGCETKTRP